MTGWGEKKPLKKAEDMKMNEKHYLKNSQKFREINEEWVIFKQHAIKQL